MESRPSTGAGRSDALLLAAALLLVGVVGWIVLSGPGGSNAAGGSGVADSPAADGAPAGTRPEAGHYEGGADAPPPPHEPTGVLPPDRAFTGRAAVDALIRGRVTAPDWVEWPGGVQIELSRQGEDAVLQRREATERDPEFRFDAVPFGHYAVTLRAGDFLTQRALVTADADHPVLYQQLPLLPGTRIIGRVTDENGRPVAEMPVTAVPVVEGGGGGGVPRTASTDPDGRFRIAGLQPGSYEIFAGGFRAPLSEVQRLRVTRERVEAWADLVVPAMGSARVALDFRGETPSEERRALLRVQALRVGAPGEKGHSESRAVNEEGVARFPALPPGDYAFTAYGGPFRRTTRRAGVIADQQTEVSIPLRALNDGDGGR